MPRWRKSSVELLREMRDEGLCPVLRHPLSGAPQPHLWIAPQGDSDPLRTEVRVESYAATLPALCPSEWSRWRPTPHCQKSI